MAQYALVDADGLVFNVIEADQDFIDALPELVVDPDVDTSPELKRVRETAHVNHPDAPAIGWRRNGKNWERPVPPKRPDVDPPGPLANQR